MPNTVVSCTSAAPSSATVVGSPPDDVTRSVARTRPVTNDVMCERTSRRYLMPVRPYSLAVRVLHSARYGRDSDDPRMASSFLGSNYYVRGHRLDIRQCPPDPTRVCGDELLGSRVMVSNVELRVPLWGIVSRQLDYGRLPADAFVFADGGLVWSAGRRANSISSVGAGFRLNAGGLPFEFAMIRALDGPRPGWQPEFGFRVGF